MSNNRKASLEVWSFFSGAMGLDLGLEKAGVHPTLAVERDPNCCATIRRNRPALDLWETDIRDIDGAALKKRRRIRGGPFLMVGGPPCQSFSPGGKRAALTDPRGNLIYSYLRLVNEVRPRYFILENVANIITAALRHRPIAERPGQHWNLSRYQENRSDNNDNSSQPMQPDELSGSAIRRIIGDMSTLGYSISFAVVNAADYGAPQKRLRFILFGARHGCPPSIIPPTHGEVTGAERWRTLRDTIYELRDRPGPHSVYTPGVAKYFDLISPGGHWRDLPAHLQPKALGEASYRAGGGKTGFYRRLAWDSPAPTITGRANRKGSALCHPQYTRPLSVRECARIQGFPDHWLLQGSMSQQYMQVGNAVPVQLGCAVGESIQRHVLASQRLKKPKQPDVESMFATAVQKLRASARNKRRTDAAQLTLFSENAG